MLNRYAILRRGDRAFCEFHTTLLEAERALKVLNEHEELHGRGKDYWFIEDRLKTTTNAVRDSLGE